LIAVDDSDPDFIEYKPGVNKATTASICKNLKSKVMDAFFFFYTMGTDLFIGNFGMGW
jgi:hypothetical protein